MSEKSNDAWPPMEIVPFGSTDADNILARHPEYADRLPYGVVQLDRAGTILRFSKSEAIAIGREPHECLNRSFFDDIAPCAKGQRIEEEFNKFLDNQSVNVLFDYIYGARDRPINVRMNMKSASDGESIWLFIKRVLPVR